MIIDTWYTRPLLKEASNMQRYGNVIVGMDATYKVTKWSFPFFLVTVVDNHSHAHPVGMFLPQHETGASIAEALQILREWNPAWRPKHFMLDKDNKEENAVNEV